MEEGASSQTMQVTSRCWKWKWKLLSRVQLWDTRDYTVQGLFQVRILEWVAFPFSRGSSQPRDGTQVSDIAGRFFTSWATREAPRILKWVAYSFSSRFAQPRNWMGVFCIAGGFFTNWAIRKAQKLEKARKLIHSQETRREHNPAKCLYFDPVKSNFGLLTFRNIRQ